LFSRINIPLVGVLFSFHQIVVRLIARRDYMSATNISSSAPDLERVPRVHFFSICKEALGWSIGTI
jgi:hypothetical protein